jgi:hypothetical protein
MDVTITPSALRGSVPAVPSKSVAHRLLILAALADEPHEVPVLDDAGMLWPGSRHHVDEGLDAGGTCEGDESFGLLVYEDALEPQGKVVSLLADDAHRGGTTAA